MTALSFVPEYDEILDFEDNVWIVGLDQRNRKRLTVFPVSLLNCFKYVSENISRTNNFVKGWHNGFVFTLNASHQLHDNV